MSEWRPGALVRKLGEFADIFIGDKKKPLQYGDIILTRVSGTVEYVGQPIYYEGKPLGRNPVNVIVVRITEYGKRSLEPKYAYYRLLHAWQQGYWKRMAHGTLQQFININMVKDFPLGAITRTGELVPPPPKRPIKPYKVVESPGFTALPNGVKRLARLQFEREYYLHPEKRKWGLFVLLEGRVYAEFHPYVQCPACGWDVVWKHGDQWQCASCLAKAHKSRFIAKDEVLEFYTSEESKQRREFPERHI